MSLSTLLLWLLFFFWFGSDTFFLRSARFSSRSDPGSRNECSPHAAVLCLHVLHLFQRVYHDSSAVTAPPAGGKQESTESGFGFLFTLTSASQRQKRDAVWRTEPEQLGLLIAAQTGFSASSCRGNSRRRPFILQIFDFFSRI